MKAHSLLSVLVISQFGVPNLALAQAPGPNPTPATTGSTGGTPSAPNSSAERAAPAATVAVTPNPAAKPEYQATPADLGSKSAQVAATTQPAGNATTTQPTTNATTTQQTNNAPAMQVPASGMTEPTHPASTLTTVEASLGSAESPTSAQAAVTGPRVIAVSARPAETAAPPRPRKLRYPLSVQLDVMPVWQTSNGFDLFSTNDIATRVGLSAGYDVLDVARNTPVGLELGWSTESHGVNGFFPGLNTAFSAHSFHGGLKLRHQLLPFLAPYANVLVGAARMKTTFEVASANRSQEFETVKWAPFAMLGAGLAAMLPIDNRVAFGASAETGYVVSGSMPLRFDPTDMSGALPGARASMGVLERSGPYLRFAFFVRY